MCGLFFSAVAELRRFSKIFIYFIWCGKFPESLLLAWPLLQISKVSLSLNSQVSKKVYVSSMASCRLRFCYLLNRPNNNNNNYIILLLYFN